MEYPMVSISSVSYTTSQVAYGQAPQAPQALPNAKLGMCERASANVYLAFKCVTKAASLVQGSTKIVGGFSKVPHELAETTTALKSLKIIKGVLAIADLPRFVVKVVRSTDLRTRLLSGWKVVGCVDKIVSAVETIFYYLKELKVLSGADLAWTTITGYVFLPVSIISTGISGYLLAEKSKFMSGFNAKLKQIKVEHSASEVVATKVCQELMVQEKHLRKFKIITDECPLKSRLEGILVKLAAENAAIKKEAADEVRFIKKCLKDRIREQVGIAAVKTSASTIGVACTIIGLACPPAAPALAIVGIVLTVVGIGNFAYSKFVPRGDIQVGEKRMFFAKARKGVQKAVRAVDVSCMRFKLRLQAVAKLLLKQQSPKFA